MRSGTLRTAHTARVTSLDVARLAGVSQSAVSRALTPGASISADMRRRVMEAAEALGYTPNVFARSLITRRSDLIGVVMGEVTSAFYAEVLDRLGRSLQERGQRVLFAGAPLDAGPDQAVGELLQYHVAGIVITSATLSRDVAARCAAAGAPVVLLNRKPPQGEASSVRCDSVNGGFLAGDLLARAGHQRFAFIGGLPGAFSSKERERGFAQALSRHGKAITVRAEGGFTYGGGFAVARELLQSSAPPDAIFCGSDEMALGAVDATRVLGLRVPKDVSVIGFDDIPAAAWEGYRLTTIRQPVERMVERTLEILFGQIERPGSKRVVQQIAGELVVRSSSRLPAGQLAATG